MNNEIKTGSIISERNSYTQFDCDGENNPRYEIKNIQNRF
jgi:hypothetical protein